MSRHALRIVTRSVGLLVLAAAIAQAQPGNRDPRRASRMEEGGNAAAMPSPPPTLASMIMDHEKDFSLNSTQKTKIEALRALQDSANKPWMEKLDSLRRLRPDADAADERRRTGMAFMENLRIMNEDAAKQVMDLLNPDQQKRAQELQDEAQKKMESQMRRRPDNDQQTQSRGRRP